MSVSLYSSEKNCSQTGYELPFPEKHARHYQVPPLKCPVDLNHTPYTALHEMANLALFTLDCFTANQKHSNYQIDQSESSA